MGWNDHLEEYGQANLPDEAYKEAAYPIEIRDEWLRNAPRDLQLDAMRAWFLARFEDPANETPYNGREGGFIFINGGPYDPGEELPERFFDVVGGEVIDELTNELYMRVGDEWAPIDYGVDYDDELSMRVYYRKDPLEMLTDRLNQIATMIEANGSGSAQQLSLQLAHGAAITALEAYLWDTVAFWISADQDVLKDFVSTNQDYAREKIPLSTIFDEFSNLQDRFESYLSELVWHRLDKIKPMLEQGLKIAVPEIATLMEQVIIRHHIIHRGGRDKDGAPIRIFAQDVQNLVAEVKGFATAIEDQLTNRFPDSGDDLPF